MVEAAVLSEDKIITWILGILKKDNKKIMFIALAVIVLGVVFSLGRCSSNDSDDLSKKESKIEAFSNSLPKRA